MDQQLTPRREVPIVIETAHGFITLTATKGKGLHIVLPPGLKAFLGLERAWEHAQFLQQHNGLVVPRYNLLQPIVGPRGIEGLVSPSIVRLQSGVRRVVPIEQPKVEPAEVPAVQESPS